MSRVAVTELKARLSHYLREVRRGGEVEVLERGIPIARLIGIETTTEGSEEERRERLVRSGVLKPASSDASELLEQPPLEISSSILEALEEERTDRV